jgi:hypothetical protein
MAGQAVEAPEYYDCIELPPHAMRHSIVILRYCSKMDYKGNANIFGMDEKVVRLTYELSERFAKGEKALYAIMDASQIISLYTGPRGRSLLVFLEGQRKYKYGQSEKEREARP